MSEDHNNIEQVIIKLEVVKYQLKDCNVKEDLISKIDQVMENLIGAQNEVGSDILATNGELVTKLRYLRELRASALDLSDEQVLDFSRDLSLIVSSMQFQLWQGDNKSLFSLLDKNNS